MYRKLLLLLGLLCLLALPLAAQAQTSTPPPPVDPNANISWPPPIYLLSGDFPVRGSANLANMVSHFLEVRPLDDFGSTIDESFPWIPVTLPSTAPVLNDVLGIWDTTIVPDGAYEMRLTINISGGSPVHFVVRPLRVENVPPPFVATATPFALPTLAAPIQPTALPTLAATPTPFSTEPQGEVVVASGNVRSGDTIAYDIVGVVRLGDVLPIIGVSGTGSGWWRVRLPNGREGWVAPSLVRVTGNTATLPRQFPPPPPATPTPTFTPTPVSQADLIITSISLTPANPACKVTFTINVTVQNVGTTVTNSSGTISIQDIHINTGTVTETTVGGFPILNPGQSFTSNIPITVDTFFNEGHRITAFVDSLGQVIETNETNNFGTLDYTLGKGSC